MGDCLQAKGLIEGRAGARHVMADAAYDDADYLRDFIADGLDAPARIKQNPTRTARKTIEWALYRERHLFFNRSRRFRRSALRCK